MAGKAVAKAQAKTAQKVASKKNEDDEAYVAKGKAAKNKEESGSSIKRPLSAYFIYCNERRETLKAESPSLSMTE